MRTRSHLLRTFLSAYVILTLLAGAASYQLLHIFLRQQAEESARALATVITEGGFTLSERIQRRMADLTGYEFEVILGESPDAASHPPQGTVSVAVPGGMLRVYYQTDAYQTALKTVLLITLAVAGSGIVLFAIVAWRLSRVLARPLEQLAESAMAIGRGDWQIEVPRVGSSEVRRLAADLDAMRQQLCDLDTRNRHAERLATLGVFTATIAHEVRNPLSAIRLSIQLLRQQLPEQPALALIENEIERLDDIVDELLGYSRGMTVELRPCALHEVASDVCRLLDRQARHAGVVLTSEGEGWVLADGRRLRQLLLNLVLNAIQALHGSGQVDEEEATVTIRVLSHAVWVDDNGPGVAEDCRPTLFSPFVTTRSQGTGLGLHLAYLIAQAHGAELSYEALSPKGSRFRLDALKALDESAQTTSDVSREYLE